MTYYERRLPHWQPPGREVFITWRLYGSLPQQASPLKGNSTSGQAFVHYDRILDCARTGPLWLKDPRVANLVLRVLSEAQRQGLFTLGAYVLMTNHVHVLLDAHAPIGKITRQIKGATARVANTLLNRTGNRFWQDESFDHWVRNSEERQKIRVYIERNPVSAGLVTRPEEWPWSSASHPIE